MIVVTGATGQLGRLVIEGLLKSVPPYQLGVSVRDLGKAEDLRSQGVRVVKGDFADSQSLGEAFEGAEQVLIVSVNKLGDEAVQQHGNAFRAAKTAGVKRVLYTSHQGANPSSAVAFARDHAASEALLQASGVPFVSLRNGFYAESALYQLGGMKETGRLALPGDGPVSWTARADLAEAAVAALTNTTLFEGISPPLTSSEALDFAKVASLCAEILGREITRVVVSSAEYRADLLGHGFPETMADMLGSLFQATRDREFDFVDPTLEQVLGRKPLAMSQVLRHFFVQA